MSWRVVLILVALSKLAGGVSGGLVSTSPQVTEWLFQLGKGNDLVAVSSMSDYPAAAKQLPRLGPLFAPGVELVLRFSPRWVISDGWSEPPGLARALESAGIAHFVGRINSVETLFSESARLLHALGESGESAELSAFRRCLPTPFPTEKRFPFLAFVWSSPPILFGHATFLSDLITRVGGKNALPENWSTPYPQISEEWLMRREFSTLFFLDDSPNAASDIHRIASKLWPKKELHFIPLPAELFARANFTPLLNVNHLRAGSRPRECSK